MHELSIALSLIDTASEKAEAMGDVRVAAIHLKMGALSGVVKQALLSAFEMAREGSPLQECELVIKDIPIAVFCDVCQAERPVVSPQDISCDVCRTPSPNIVHGRELEVTALEVFQ